MKPLQLIVKTLGISVFFFVILFVSAGRIDYWQGWLYVVMNLLMTFMTVIASAGNKELINERFKPGAGIKMWDKVLLGISATVYLIMLIVSGLDSGRFKWSPELHWSIYTLGVGMTLLGHALFLTAKRQNKFFSTVVRIQTERGHTVCDTGLYKVIRHPGYFGMFLSNLGFPFMLGSMWSFVPVTFSVGILFIRTYLEDKTLTAELNGYEEYTHKTRYRLIPVIW